MVTARHHMNGTPTATGRDMSTLSHGHEAGAGPSRSAASSHRCRYDNGRRRLRITGIDLFLLTSDGP